MLYDMSYEDFVSQEHQLAVQKLKPFLDKIIKSNLILNIGCKFGTFAEWLSKNKGMTVGVDDDILIIKRAKEKTGLEYIYQDDYKPLKFKNNNFDCVFIYDELKNIKNPKELLIEVKRVLKPDGRLYLIMPLYGLHVKEVGLFKYMPETKGELNNLITSAGFKVKESIQINSQEKLDYSFSKSKNQIVFIYAIK